MVHSEHDILRDGAAQRAYIFVLKHTHVHVLGFGGFGIAEEPSSHFADPKNSQM